MNTIEVTVVIPVYNSERTIGQLIELMQEELEGKYSYNFVLVNDGSSDRSYWICRELAEQDRRVKFISFFKNFGQLSAIIAGLQEADGEIVVVMDDDLQNPPHEVHKLISAIQQGYDFVFGIPKKMKQSLWRCIGSYISVKMAEIVFGKPKGLYASSYYALHQKVVQEVIKYDGPFPYISGLIVRITKNGCNIPVEHNSRKYGKSGYDFKKLFMLWLNGLTNFSVLPLRIATFVGVASATVGFLYLLLIIIHKLLTPNLITPGWTSVVGFLLLFSGIQLFALGLLGEYVGRIFLLLNKTPQYTVREKYNCEVAPD